MARTVISLLAVLFLIAAAPPPPLSDQDRREIIDNVASLLEQRYVDAEGGARLAKRMRGTRTRWDSIRDPKAFAEAMTEWLRGESGDGHLGLSYSEQPIPEQGGEAAFSAAEMERWYGAHLNHGVEKVERLDGNIMLLDLRVFPPARMGADVVAAAMNVVAQGDALILDLRRNGGGAETANLVTGFLLD